MRTLKDCSELREAGQLVRDLMGGEGDAKRPPVTAGFRRDRLRSTPRVPSPGRGGSVSTPHRPAAIPVAAGDSTFRADPERVAGAGESVSTGTFRADRLESVLVSMCHRGGFAGAVLADDSGLPLAVHNSPVGVESLAAFTSILGDALEKAGSFLGQHEAQYLSMDINYEDKAVLRRFSVGNLDLFLMLLCQQGVDERSEVEVSVSQLVSVLT